MIKKECQRNFETFVQAIKRDDIAVVLCKNAKGKEFQTLCVVFENPDDPNKTCYTPFGFMANPTFYPLLNSLSPPENLKGDWMWEI